MIFVFLLLALAVSVVGAWLSRRSLLLGRVLMVVGGLGLITVVAIQVRQNLFPPQPKTSSLGEMAVGSRLANYVVSDLAGQSGTVILLFPPRALMNADTEQSYEEGFTLPARHARGTLHLKALHLEAERGKAGYHLAAFRQALEQASDALAIVSYAGAPAGFDTLFSAGQPKLAPFYVFDAEGTTNWLGPLKEGRVKVVVLPRPGVDSRAREAAAGRSEAIFERFYLLATPGTADQVAAQLSKR
jgi:hypothetical protein